MRPLVSIRWGNGLVPNMTQAITITNGDPGPPEHFELTML